MYDNIPETELVWVKGKPGHVPQGAVVAGQRSNGDLLYVAKANDEAGHYDAGRDCVEYYRANCGTCFTSYWILTREHSGYWTQSPCACITTLVLLLHEYTRKGHNYIYGREGYKNTFSEWNKVYITRRHLNIKSYFQIKYLCANKSKVTKKHYSLYKTYRESVS